MLCPRACTYVCMYGLGIYESYLKQFSTQGAEYLTKCENAICIINATAVDWPCQIVLLNNIYKKDNKSLAVFLHHRTEEHSVQ